MHFPTVISTLTLLASAAAQADSNQVAIRLWTDPDFRGREFTGSAQMGDCKDLENPFNDRVLSGRARENRMRCTVWADRGCTGPSVSFGLSGDRDFRGNFGGRGGSSWKCERA